jgi:hypothetical protein
MSNARNLANLLGTNTQITTADIADGAFQANKNLIINGAMQVAQRGTSQTGVTSSGYASAPDRFSSLINGLGTWTLSQSSDAPDGFSSSYKWECTIADSSISAGDYGILLQRMEGQNLQHLKKGSSNAESLTASFWVKSSKTGTYIFEMYENHSQRSISKSYTISSANTWEYKSITIPGDTVGTINNDNTQSLIPAFWVAAGSVYSSGTLQTSWGSIVSANRAVGVVNLADTVGNTWQVTGVQLELGSTATPFEHRSYGDELARCQRYCHIIGDTQYQAIGIGTMYTSTASIFYVHTPVSMRSSPSVSKVAGGVGTTWLQSYVGSTGTNSNPTPELGENSTNGRQNNFRIYAPGSNSSATVGSGTWNQIMPNASLIFDAEL